MQKISQIDEKIKQQDVFYEIQMAIEMYSKMSPIIPTQAIGISKNIYERFDRAIEYLERATLEEDLSKKAFYLRNASDEIFIQYGSFQTLVTIKGLSMGQVTQIIPHLKESYKQLKKWLKSILPKLPTNE